MSARQLGIISVAVALSLILLPTAALSVSQEDRFSGPMSIRNDSPLYITLFATPIADRAKTVAEGASKWSLGYLNSNNIIQQHNSTERDFFLIDMEVHRIEANFKYSPREYWELGVNLPYIYMNGGFTDNFIQEFEDLFGLETPGARSSRNRNDLRYQVRVKGIDLINKEDESIRGLGDIAFQAKYQFRDAPEEWLPRASVRAMLKLPTATDPLIGNQRPDGGIGILGEQNWGDWLLLWANLDLTSAQLPRKLKSLDNDSLIITSSLGFEHILTDRASWKGQMTIGSNPYPDFDDAITSVGRLPLGVGLGFSYRVNEKSTVQFQLAENVNSAWPDFSWGGSFKSEF